MMREFRRGDTTGGENGDVGDSGPDGGVSLPSFFRMNLMRGSTSWSAYLRGGWVDAVSVHGTLDGCVGECEIGRSTRGAGRSNDEIGKEASGM